MVTALSFPPHHRDRYTYMLKKKKVSNVCLAKYSLHFPVIFQFDDLHKTFKVKEEET